MATGEILQSKLYVEQEDEEKEEEGEEDGGDQEKEEEGEEDGADEEKEEGKDDGADEEKEEEGEEDGGDEEKEEEGKEDGADEEKEEEGEEDEGGEGARPALCELCEEGDQHAATHTCQDCQSHMCRTCRRVHDKLMANHHVTSVPARKVSKGSVVGGAAAADDGHAQCPPLQDRTARVDHTQRPSLQDLTAILVHTQRTSLQDLTARVDRVFQFIAEATDKLKKLTENDGELENNMTSRSDDLEKKLNSRVDDLERKLDSLSNDLEKKLNSCNDDISLISSRSEDLGKKLKSRSDDMEKKLNSRSDDLEKKIDQRTAILEQYLKNIKKNEQRTAVLEQDVNNLKKNEQWTAVLEQDVNNLKKTGTETQKAMDTLRATFGKAEVAFHVRGVDLQKTKQGNPIVFGHVVCNQGDGYDVSTGRFKAAVAGSYTFSASVRSKAAGKTVTAYLFGNDTDYAFLRGTDTAAQSATVNVALKAGDIVWVLASNPPAEYSGGFATQFSGALVQPHL